MSAINDVVVQLERMLKSANRHEVGEGITDRPIDSSALPESLLFVR